MTGWRNISGEISVSVFGRLVFWLALTQLSFRFLWFGCHRLVGYRMVGHRMVGHWGSLAGRGVDTLHRGYSTDELACSH